MAGSAVVGSLRVNLALDTAEFSKSLASSADKMSAKWKTFGRQATDLGGTLTKALSVPLAGIAAASIKAGVDFESSFAGVRKTVNATESQFADLAQGFRDLSKTIPVNVNELNKIGEAAGQLGIKRDQILKFTDVIARLGVSSNLAGDEAATMLARFANITGMAREAEPPFDRLGSTIVALGNTLATTEREIAEMGLRLAGVGAQIGLSEADILSLAGALSSVGIEAEAGGTAFSRVMLKMQDAVLDGGDALRTFSQVAGIDFKRAFQDDAAVAINAFIGGLARMSESGQSLTPILRELELGEIRVSDALRRTGNAVEVVTDAVKTGRTSWQENNALQKESDERFKTTASRAVILANKIGDVGITLHTALKPAIDAAFVALDKFFLPALTKLSQAFADLPPAIQTFVLAGAGIVGMAGPAIWSMGQLANAASTLSGAFGKKAVVVRALSGVLSGPLALALLGVGAGFVAAKADADAYFDTLERRRAQMERQAELLEAYRKVTGDTGAVLVDFTRLTEEQQQQLLSLAKTAGDARTRLTGFRIEVDQTSGELRGLRDGTVGGTDGLGELSDEAKRAAEELQRVVDVLTGQALADEIAALEYQVRVAGQQGGITRYQFEQLGKQLQQMKDQGGELTPALEAIRQSHIRLAFAQQFGIGTSAQYVESMQRTIQLTREQIRVMGMGGLVKGMDFLKLPGPMLQLPKLPPSAANVYGQELGATIMAAVTGGGSVGRAIGTKVGNDIGTHLSKEAGKQATGFFTTGLGGLVSAALPGVGALLGPMVGKLGGAIKGLFDGGQGAKVNDLRDSFLESAGGAEKLYAQLALVGREDLWQPFMHGPGKVKAMEQAIADIEQALAKAQEAASRYGLSLDDAGTPAERLSRKTQILLTDFRTLSDAGFSVEQMAGAMADQLNEVVSLALESGQQLPAAFGPFLEQLIRGGQLTDELAAKLLGVTSPVPWKEMAQAAERYGISVDALGKKFDQAKLDDTSKQIAADWKLLADNGADINAVMAGMKDEVQELISKALALGLQIPDAMRPLVEAMFAAGQLTDENGDRLEDLSRIQFAAPIENESDILISKIGELIDKLTGGLYPAISNIPSPSIDVPGGPSGRSSSAPAHGNPQYDEHGNPVPGFSRGGVVNAGDGANARLHGYEGIFPLPAGFSIGALQYTMESVNDFMGRIGRGSLTGGRPVQITVVSQLDGREVARNQMQYFADELWNAGVMA